MAGRIGNRLLVGATLVVAATVLLLPAAPAQAQIQVGASSCRYADSALGSLSRGALNSVGRCMINEQRVRRGLRYLTTSRRLFRAARSHNIDMIWHLGWLTHSSSNGESAVHRILRFGYARGARSWSVAECIAFSYGVGVTPRTIIRGWLNSPEHRKIMLSSRWKQFGVSGRHGAPGNPLAWGATYTVDFGRRR